MRILIWNDMEGPSGIDDRKMLDDEALYPTAKQYATDDINAAIRGIRKSHPEAIIDIFDGHGMGNNLLLEKLESGVNYLGGGWMTTFYSMVKEEELDKYTAVMLLGQHAADGTEKGFVCHTNTGLTGFKVNGKFAGEAPQIAWLFGHFDVPVLLVVGDDATSREAKALLPGITTVIVKEALSKTQAKSIPLEEAHKQIEVAAFETLSNLSKCKPFKVDLPVSIEIHYFAKEMADIHEKFPRTERIGEYSVKYLAEDYLEGWLAYNIARPIVNLYLNQETLKMIYSLNLEEVNAKQKEYNDDLFHKVLYESPMPKVKY
ncbi:MAG: M55 family metallopeptidase [Candidatus Heimdallarchaeota archaeon]